MTERSCDCGGVPTGVGVGHKPDCRLVASYSAAVGELQITGRGWWMRSHSAGLLLPQQFPKKEDT